MTALDRILDHVGFAHRPEQDALFAHLLTIDHGGVVAQAGTGTGKSIAILAAAAEQAARTARPALVVTPTNVLMSQYIEKDAPRVAEALGITIRALKGRNHYLCPYANGWELEETRMSQRQREQLAAQLNDPRTVHEVPVGRGEYGCPGSDECLDEDGACHYRRAKAMLGDADIIVTNAHLMVIDDQIRQETDGDAYVFPEVSAVFVDEAHTLEEVARGFLERSLNENVLRGMLPASSKLMTLVEQAHSAESSFTIRPQEHAWVYWGMRDLVKYVTPSDEKVSQRRLDAARAAERIVRGFDDGHYQAHREVLWFEPRIDNRPARFVSTAITLGGMIGPILQRHPFALVSATIPSTLSSSLGVPGARFIDVGHPFDYARQATIGYSTLQGDYRTSKDFSTVRTRARELLDQVLASQGGALLLFSSYRDLEVVHGLIEKDLRRHGLKVLVQDRDSDKQRLGDAFRHDGDAVLFGTESFATGFDVPGNALRFVGIWKVPYPGLSPVTRAISAASFARYRDMALVKMVQGIGRAIRTTDDRARIWIADSRAQPMLNNPYDPMVAHIAEMRTSC